MTEECPKCGGEMDIYYGAWCPRCDKPERKPVITLNLIKCLRYIEAQGNPGYKDRMWRFLIDDIKGNDIIIPWFYAETNREEDYPYDDDEDGYTQQNHNDLVLFNETFNIGVDENIQLEVSW